MRGIESGLPRCCREDKLSFLLRLTSYSVTGTTQLALGVFGICHVRLISPTKPKFFRAQGHLHNSHSNIPGICFPSEIYTALSGS